MEENEIVDTKINDTGVVDTKIADIWRELELNHINTLIKKMRFNTNETISLVITDKDDDEFDNLEDEKYFYEGQEIFESKGSELPYKIDLKYNIETSYYSFYYNVWRKLTLPKKVVSCIWFSDLLSYEVKKDRIPPIINYDQDLAIDYIYDKKEESYSLSINPFQLQKENGYDIMLDLVNISIKDEIFNMAADYVLGDNNSDKYSKLIYSNFYEEIEAPEDYYNYIEDKNFSENELKEIDDFSYNLTELENGTNILINNNAEDNNEVFNSNAKNNKNNWLKEVTICENQPIKLEKIRAIFIMDNYIKEIKDVFGFEDVGWVMERDELLKQFKKAEILFKRFYPKLSVEKVYSKFFKKELDLINKKRANAIVNKRKSEEIL